MAKTIRDCFAIFDERFEVNKTIVTPRLFALSVIVTKVSVSPEPEPTISKSFLLIDGVLISPTT